MQWNWRLLEINLISGRNIVMLFVGINQCKILAEDYLEESVESIMKLTNHLNICRIMLLLKQDEV